MPKPRKGFQHWMGRNPLPKPLKEEYLLRYYALLRFGSPRIKERAARAIVMAHVRLGFAAVARWALTFRSDTDEMVSEMLIGLVEGVKLISEGAIDHHERQNIGGYLQQTIHGRLNKLLLKKKQELGPRIRKVVSIDHNLLELNEIIAMAITNGRERKVIDLRIKGHNDVEISQMMKLTPMRIQQIRTGVKNRITENLNADSNRRSRGH